MAIAHAVMVERLKEVEEKADKEALCGAEEQLDHELRTRDRENRALDVAKRCYEEQSERSQAAWAAQMREMSSIHSKEVSGLRSEIDSAVLRLSASTSLLQALQSDMEGMAMDHQRDMKAVERLKRSHKYDGEAMQHGLSKATATGKSRRKEAERLRTELAQALEGSLRLASTLEMSKQRHIEQLNERERRIEELSERVEVAEDEVLEARHALAVATTTVESEQPPWCSSQEEEKDREALGESHDDRQEKRDMELRRVLGEMKQRESGVPSEDNQPRTVRVKQAAGLDESLGCIDNAAQSSTAHCANAA